MHMDPRDMAISDAAAAELLRPMSSSRLEWTDSDLGEMLTFQLDGSLRSLPCDSIEGTIDGMWDTQSITSDCSIRDLFAEADPPLALLWNVKRCAQAARDAAGDRRFASVPYIVYLLAICVAQLRHGILITTLSVDEIKERVEWAQGRSWLDPWSRDALEQWLAMVRSA